MVLEKTVLHLLQKKCKLLTSTSQTPKIYGNEKENKIKEGVLFRTKTKKFQAWFKKKKKISNLFFDRYGILTVEEGKRLWEKKCLQF